MDKRIIPVLLLGASTVAGLAIFFWRSDSVSGGRYTLVKGGRVEHSSSTLGAEAGARVAATSRDEPADAGLNGLANSATPSVAPEEQAVARSNDGAANRPTARRSPSVPDARTLSATGSSTRADSVVTMPTSAQSGGAGSFYGPFFEATKLDAATRSRFLAVVDNHDLSVEEITELSKREGLSHEQAGALILENSRDTDAKLKSVLGEKNFAALNEYTGMLVFRPLAVDTATRCVTNGVAMSPSTVEALTAAIFHCESSALFIRSRRIMTDEEYRQATMADHYAVDAARPVLTAEQLRFFQQSLALRYKRR